MGVKYKEEEQVDQFAICIVSHNTLRLPPSPQILSCSIIVFIFSWDGCNTQEKWKTKVIQFFWGGGGGVGGEGGNKVHYGRCASG